MNRVKKAARKHYIAKSINAGILKEPQGDKAKNHFKDRYGKFVNFMYECFARPRYVVLPKVRFQQPASEKDSQ